MARRAPKRRNRPGRALVTRGFAGVYDNLDRDPFQFYSRGNPFPPFMWTEQRFSAQLQVGATNNSLIGGEVIFRLNSIYTPQLSSGVTTYGQPTMIDIYDHYVVTDVGIDVEFSDPTADGMYCFAMVQRSQGSTALNGQQPTSAMDIPGVFSGPLNNTGGQTCRAIQQMGIHEIEGLTRSQIFDELSEYGAAGSANPSRTPYLRCAVSTFADDAICQLTVRLTFKTKWYGRKEFTQ